MITSGESEPGAGRDRFLERRIVIRGRREAIELSYADEVRTLVTVHLEPWEEDLREVQRDTERLFGLEPVALARLGDTLGRILFPVGIGEQFEADGEAAQRAGRRLRLGILDLGPVFPDWPWEYVRLPAMGFVGLSPHVSLQRLQAADGAEGRLSLTLPGGQSLRALLVYADPVVPDCAALAADAQVHGLRRLILNIAPRCQTEVLWPAGRAGKRATRSSLASEVAARPPHILIFIAHGGYDGGRQEGVVHLESDRGPESDPLSGSDLAAILDQSPTPCLVLLDACWTANRGPKSGAKSVAAALTLPHRTVVGMQGLWPASACVPFWATFFASLLQPSPADDALFAAREHLLRIGPETPDWGRAALHRSAVPPSPPVIRTRSVSRPGSLDAFMGKCRAWLRHHLPNAVGTAVDPGVLGKRLRKALAADQVSGGILSFGNLASHPQSDPLWIMLAADEDEAPIETTPVWFTALREAPRKLAWHASGMPGPWRVRFRALAWADVPELRSSSQEVSLPEDLLGRWPGQDRVRWEVAHDSPDNPPCVSGLIRVLSPKEWAAAEAQLGGIESLDPAARFKAAAGCVELGLFDEALRLAGALLNSRCDDALRVLAHRLMAQVYRDITRALQERPGSQKESVWAASLARWHLRASYATPAGSSLEPLQ